jgi:hypothetical protein
VKTIARASLIVFGLGLFGLGRAAGLEDLPKRKPGLWEMRTGSPDGKKSSAASRVCIDTATDATLTKFATGVTSQICTKREVKVIGSVATIDAVCNISGSVQTVHSTISFKGNTAYRADARVHSDPPLMGVSNSTATQEGKWIGPCPPDMKPGDLVMGNGTKINLKDIAAGKL